MFIFLMEQAHFLIGEPPLLASHLEDRASIMPSSSLGNKKWKESMRHCVGFAILRGTWRVYFVEIMKVILCSLIMLLLLNNALR